MSTFTSSEAIKSAILKGVNVAVDMTGDDIYQEFKEKVDEYYGAYQPVYYQRTNLLAGSLKLPEVRHSANGASVKVKFDSSNMDYPQGKVPVQQPNPLGMEYGFAKWNGDTVLNAAMLGANTRTWRNPTKIWDETEDVHSSSALSARIEKNLKYTGVI